MKKKIDYVPRARMVVAYVVAMVGYAAIMPANANQTWFVDSLLGDDANDGLGAETAFASIQKAVDSSADEDIIMVNDGVYAPFVASNMLVSIISVNGPEATLIDGGGTNRCATLGAYQQYTTFVSGFTFTNGTVVAASGGGTIGGTLSNCIYVANRAMSGGGAYGGHITDSKFLSNEAVKEESSGGYGGAANYANLWNCVVSNNIAYLGGGTYYGSLSNTVIVGNVATNGGGCYSGTMVECLVADNVALTTGGGCYSMTFAGGCVISNNMAKGQGGGFFCSPSTPAARRSRLTCSRVVCNKASGNGGGVCGSMLANCWIGNNESEVMGGGIYGGGATNCIIVANAATRQGGGAYQTDLINCTVVTNISSAAGGATHMGSAVNTIFLGNVSSSGNGLNQTTVSYSCGTGIGTEDGNIEGDPLFVDVENGNYRLRAESPCIDAGNSYGNIWPTDYDDTDRIKGGCIDMGAYETDMQEGFHSVRVEKPIGGRGSSFGGSIPDGGEFLLEVSGARPLVGIYTNGGFATALPTFRLMNVREDYVIVVRFDTSVNATFYVDAAKGNSTNLGYVAESPYASIQYAIDEAVDGDAILVSPGIYDPISVPDLRIVIESIEGAEVTTIRSMGQERPATLTAWTDSPRLGYSPTFLRGFTLRGGNPLTSDSSFGGGALGGVLENCILTGNHNINGGGAAGAILRNCIIRRNSAANGGGTLNCRLYSCLVENNTAQNQGGGLVAGFAENCLLKGNTAPRGAGVYSASLIGCTVVGNTASGQGGGTYGGTARNCIIWGNSAPGSANVEGGTLTYCCTDPLVDGDGNIAADPYLQVDGFSLGAESPCINSGLNTYSTENTDYVGNARIVGYAIDIGAYEYPVLRGTFADIWGSWSIENDEEFEFPETLADWDELAHFSWRARDKFTVSLESGWLPPSDKPLLVSLGAFAFNGVVTAKSGDPVPMDEMFGVPVWQVRVQEDSTSRKFRATVGGVEVQAVPLPAYNPEKWVESVYGSPPTWLTGEALSEWYALRARDRVELFMTLVPSERYADYLAALAQDEESIAPEDADRFLIRGIRANASTNHLHFVDVRLPSESIVTILGGSEPSSTNWTFCGIGSFGRGYSSAGLVSESRSYFIKLVNGTGDSDGDGVSDILESMVYGTNPHKADTSGGGLLDGEKLFRYCLNPFVSDTDGDGYADEEEIANGQNPIVPTPGADRTIRYVYDDDDRLKSTYFGKGTGKIRTTLSPAGNPTAIEKRGE
jgi:parallel beta-helix repeat protein